MALFQPTLLLATLQKHGVRHVVIGVLEEHPGTSGIVPQVDDYALAWVVAE